MAVATTAEAMIQTAPRRLFAALGQLNPQFSFKYHRGKLKMELGLTGKNALVCASSKGLGKGCARALAAEGVNVWLNGRDQTALEATPAGD